MWPDERVRKLVDSSFIPVRVHVKEQPQDFQALGERYGAQWTPASLVIDPDGTERHRTEGYIPADEMHAQLSLGLAQEAFARSDWKRAEEGFRDVAESHAASDVAAEATYWAGVSRYKATHDFAALQETNRRLTERHPGSGWARKASVWQ